MNENHKSIFEKALQNLNHPLSMRLSESLTFEFGTSEQASRFADEAVRARLAASTDQFKSMYGDYMVELSTNSGSSGSPTMTHKDLAKLMRKHNGKLHNTNEGSRIKSVFKEDVQLDERAKVPTYVIDRKTKKIVYGPTDTADAKLYLKKQIQPRKFMIRQIRGAAKKVGDTV